jgi:hypothetical protein
MQHPFALSIKKIGFPLQEQPQETMAFKCAAMSALCVLARRPSIRTESMRRVFAHRAVSLIPEEE